VSSKSETERDDAVPALAFVCVQNAGRSQMATALAERERERRQLDLEIITGGMDPADRVHPEVVEVMEETGMDLSERTPREIQPDDLSDVDSVITMGCSAEGVCPAGWNGENRDWDLEDPQGKDLETVRSIRDEIRRRVSILMDEIEETIS